MKNCLGAILFNYRKNQQLSQMQFANNLEVSKEFVKDIESGIFIPSMSLINKIGQVTNYEIDY